MTKNIPTSLGTHSIATVAGSAHLAELLHALPELTRAHIAAAAKFEACMQLLALGMTTAPASAPKALLDAEAFPTSNPVRLAEQSAGALDAKPDDVMPNQPARQSRRLARVLPTREERLRRLEEKKQRELAECRVRSAERHRGQRRQSLSAARKARGAQCGVLAAN